MRRYVLRRIVQLVPLLLGISLISFTIIHLAPGDPVSLFLNPQLSQADIDRIRASFGLDRPLYVQYVKWVASFARGDFGNSFLNGHRVADEIAGRLPNTLLLAGTALVLAITSGVVIGIVSAVRQYSWVDYAASVGALFGISMPTFWFGLMLMLLFAVKLRWLPTSGMFTIGEPFSIRDRVEHLIMPALVLGLADIAAYSRYVRSAMVEVLRMDFVRTARAKGLSQRVVVYKHALRNALIPVVTVIGVQVPLLISGAVVTETVFAWPGMGRLQVDSVFSRDYPVITAVNLLFAVAVVLGNFLADLAYAVVDPRIRYS